MLDSLKTTAVGTSGFAFQCLTWVPETVRVLVGICTIIYLVIKIRREIEERFDKKNSSNSR
jgi:hypothetical protein